MAFLIPSLTWSGGCVFFRSPSPDDSRTAFAKADISNIVTTCELYKIRLLEYPPDLDFLLTSPYKGRPFLNSENDIIDPWGQKYQYDPAGPHHKGEQVDIWTVDPETGKIIGNWND
jgi:hypothetical protein